MKRLIASIATFSLFAVLIPVAIAFTPTVSNGDEYGTYSGPVPSNYYAGEAFQYTVATGAWIDETADAEDSGADDVKVGKFTDAALYVGFEERFHGIVIDYYDEATDGSFVIEYYDDDTGVWTELYDGTNEDLANNDDGTPFYATWTDDDYDNWIDEPINDGSSSMYFVRLRITEDYDIVAWASQVGVIDFNIQGTISTELGGTVGYDAVPFISGAAQWADNYIYHYDNLVEGEYRLAMHADLIQTDPEFSYSFWLPGYVGQEVSGADGIDLGLTVETIDYEAPFTHLVNIVDELGGDLTVDSAIAGRSSDGSEVDCEITDGAVYCPLGLDYDDSTQDFVAALDGYVSTSDDLPDRTDYLEPQEVTDVVMDYAYSVTVVDSDAAAITSATVLAGDSLDVTCEYMEVESMDVLCF